MNFKKAFLGVIILLPILLLTGCGKQNDTDDLKQKGIEELNYIDSKLVSIINLMNNLSFENYEVSIRQVPLQSESSSDSSKQGGDSSQSSGGMGSEEGQGGQGGEGSSGGGQGSSESSGGSSGGNGGSSGGGSSSEQSATVSEMVSKNILTSDKTPKWDNIKKEIETFYTSWNAIVLDLYKLNIPSENILSFNSTLDSATLAIKNEEKISAVSSLVSLYQHIPMYLKYIEDGSSDYNIKNTKYYVVSAYSALESDDWNTARTELDNSIQSFEPLINNSEYMSTKAYNVNKAYVILMELQNSVSLRDKDIFYINYKNLMEELNVL